MLMPRNHPGSFRAHPPHLLYNVQMKKIIAGTFLAATMVGLLGLFFVLTAEKKENIRNSRNNPSESNGSSGVSTTSRETAVLGNGCFWCVEHDLREVGGVLDVTSGYTGGTTESPTYENYAEGGHREVVLVTYDPRRVSFANLVEHIVKHGDPTDAGGSFYDRGPQYAPAIYFATETEKNDARKVIDAIDELRVFEKPLPLVIIPRVQFWPAEEYHQNYAEKNPLRYKYYRNGSGRDAFIKKHWGDQTDKFTVSNDQRVDLSTSNSTPSTTPTKPWETYVKPPAEKLRALLSPVAYEVTQEEGTESPFANAYDKNHAEGIYVDILSGEPLYSSKDKYDSGTGWPSFVKPISPTAVTLREDNGLFTTRTEVRSRYADSHLGHVFDDGPADRGGMRYCMNSAALRFIPLVDMEKEGYGEYIQFVQ